MSPLLLLLALDEARAVLPLPTYPECGEEDRTDLCPEDMGGEWTMISWIPSGSRETVRAAELTMGSGDSADRAFRISTGRTDVLLAFLDSGFDYANDNYKNKIRLNTGELPLPQSADGTDYTSYDVDGNGLVNIQDYADDPRVDWDANPNGGSGELDASDVIRSFEDGVDDDGNGYVDDIAGWDFFGDDNDAYHDYAEDFGEHGDGVIEESASEGGDGGDIGHCPNCAVLPLRVGDTFVTDGARVGMAITYAVDSGASVANMAVGALTNPDLTIAAAAYARESGTLLVAAAGDENAYHPNFPAMLDGILYVHSIRANTEDENNGAYSFFNFYNCNNYGPRLVAVADSNACATGATAITTGVAGLVISAARDAGYELTPDEVYQLVVGGVDDVNLSADELEQAGTYPSAEGWDFFFGYGRVNAARAVEAASSGAIPPTMDVSSPAWFAPIDPSVGTVEITGYIAADRSGSFDWVVEYGTGADPRTWTELESGTSTSRIDGTLATLDLADIPVSAMIEAEKEETILERVARVFAPAVTVRVRATDAEGHTGELRKTFFVHADPDLVEGFPLSMGSSGESSPILADLDDDGIFEIVIADSSGYVHAYTGDGTELLGWPVVTAQHPRLHPDAPAYADAGMTLYDGMIATAAVGDLDGDGSPEVLVASGTGNVYAWHADGSTVAGWPATIEGREPEEFDSNHVYDNGIAGAPTLYDLDGDGTIEVLAAGMDQRLYVWGADGAAWGPYPIVVCSPELCADHGTRIINSPTVGDVDGDGAVEIGLGTNEGVNDGNSSVSYLFDAVSGVLEDGWPLEEGGLINRAGLLPIVGEGHPGSLAFADIDGDDDLEIASPIMLGQSPIYAHDASVALDLSYVSTNFGPDTNTNQPSLAQMTNNPAFGDMTGDGVPEFVIGGAGAYYLIALPLISAVDWQNVVGAWDGATGEMLPGWPRQIEDLQFLVAPAIADLDADGQAEAIMGSGGYLVHAWDAAGEEPEGWPKFTGNWILGSPAVGDIDGDGLLEVVVSSREGRLFAWHTQGHADQDVQWASIHHDPANTGNHETPLQAQAGPKKHGGGDDEGGCCHKGEAAALFWLLPAGMLLRRRRCRP